ncbi:MAG TPA: Uma2 family endonuclease [Gemmataceae bacterium]|nr:Uma2 family endonuclease [Gemmataceae bacterium]
MNIRVEPTPQPVPDLQADPWYYGWRYVEHTGPDGKITTVQVPLTEEDVLHPQEDDFIVQNDDHTRDCHYLKTILDAHLANRPGLHVFYDHRMDWSVEGIEPHGPDFAVIDGFPEDWNGQRGTFRLGEFAARTLLVIEVTSPTTRRGDLNQKVTEYYQAGIPYYAIVDRQFQRATQPRLFAYRPGEQGYVLVEPDEEGWLALEPIGLWLRFEEGRLVCRDAQGRRLRDYLDILHEMEQAEARAEVERARASAAEERIRQLEAELNRLRGQS